jgi:hypothetical protein
MMRSVTPSDMEPTLSYMGRFRSPDSGSYYGTVIWGKDSDRTTTITEQLKGQSPGHCGGERQITWCW